MPVIDETIPSPLGFLGSLVKDQPTVYVSPSGFQILFHWPMCFYARWEAASQRERTPRKPTLPVSRSWTSSLQGCEKIHLCYVCQLLCGALFRQPEQIHTACQHLLTEGMPFRSLKWLPLSQLGTGFVAFLLPILRWLFPTHPPFLEVGANHHLASIMDAKKTGNKTKVKALGGHNLSMGKMGPNICLRRFFDPSLPTTC